MYKLLALDLDGTLLNQENKISTQNINAVKRVIHQHGTVVLCSAVSMGDQEHDIMYVSVFSRRCGNRECQ